MLGGIDRRRPLAESYTREPRVAIGPVGGLLATEDNGGLGAETTVDWGTSRVLSVNGGSLAAGVDPQGFVASTMQAGSLADARPLAAATQQRSIAAAYITSDLPLIVGAVDGMFAESGIQKEKKKGERWIVHIDRSSNRPLGVDIDADTLVVDSVLAGGLVASWNTECPNQAVHAGDRILEVNGQREPAMVLEECRNRKPLMITMARGARAQPGAGGVGQGRLPAWLAEKSWMSDKTATLRKDRELLRGRIKDTHRHDHAKMEAHVKDGLKSNGRPDKQKKQFGRDIDNVTTLDTDSIADSDAFPSAKVNEDFLEELGVFEEEVVIKSNASDDVAEKAGPLDNASNPDKDFGAPWWSGLREDGGDKEEYDGAAQDEEEAAKIETDSAIADGKRGDSDEAVHVEDAIAHADDEVEALDGTAEEDDGWWPDLGVLGLDALGLGETKDNALAETKQQQKQDALDRGPLGALRAKPRWDTSWEAPAWPSNEKPWAEERAWWAPKAVESLQPPAREWPGESKVQPLQTPTAGWDQLLDMSAPWPGEPVASSGPQQSPKNPQSPSRVRREEKKVVTAVADPPVAGMFWEKPALSPVVASTAAKKPGRPGADEGLHVRPPRLENPEHRLVRVRIKRSETEIGIRFHVGAWPPEVDTIEPRYAEIWKDRDIHAGDHLVEVDGIETEGCSLSRVQELLGRRPVLLVFRRSILNYMSMARQRLDAGTLQPPDTQSAVDDALQEANCSRSAAQRSPVGHVTGLAPRDQARWIPNTSAEPGSMMEASMDASRTLQPWTFDGGSPRSDASTTGSIPKRGMRIVVTIVNAKGLWRADRHGACAPFSVCHVAGKTKVGFQTRVLEGWNPEWNHSYELHGYEEGDNLEFSVWDQNMKGKGLLGKAYMQSLQFYPRGFEGDLKLTDAWNKPRGLLEVKISAWDQSKATEVVSEQEAASRVKSPSPPVAASFGSERKIEWDLGTVAPAPWDVGRSSGKRKTRADVLAKVATEVDLDNPPVLDDAPLPRMHFSGAKLSDSWIKTTSSNLDDAAELLSDAQVLKMERLTRQAERAAHCAERARLEEMGHSREIQESMRRAETATRSAWRQCEADLEEQARAAIKLADKLRFEELVSAQESEAWKADPARDEVLEKHAKELAFAEHAVRLEELKNEKEAQLTMYKTQSVMWQAKQAAVVSRVAEMAHEAQISLEQGKADEQLALAQLRNAARIEDNTRMRRTEDAMYLAMNTERDLAYRLEQDAMERAREVAAEQIAATDRSVAQGKPAEDVAAFFAERRQHQEAELEALEAAAETEAAERLNAEIEVREELQHSRDELSAMKKEEIADHERQRNLHVQTMEKMFASILNTERDRHARQLQDERSLVEHRLDDARRRSWHRSKAIDGLRQELANLRKDVDAMPPQDGGAREKLQIWTVEIDRSNGETLGFDLEDRPDDALNVVLVAEAGLVPEFNKRKPLETIQEGDRILRVNGQAGALLMKDQLRQPQVQRIVFARAPKDNFDVSKMLATEPRTWTIQIDRTLGVPLGMELGEGDDGRLRVLSVEQTGLVPAWNRVVPAENPDQLVQKGDRLLAVNGKTEVEEMKEELAQHALLEITLSRAFGETIVRPVVLKELTDEEEVDDADVFTIEINRTEGKHVGVDMHDNMENAFEIDEVSRDGLVFAWNQENGDHAVKQGDLIFSVNGRTGTLEMADELEQLQVLEITLRRGQLEDEELPGDENCNDLDKYGRTCLHRFARRGKDEKCMDLLSNPYFTMSNAIDLKGNRALHYAAAEGLVEVVEVLCEKADFDVDEERNKDGKTAADMAREQGHLALMRIIAAAGSNFRHDGW